MIYITGDTHGEFTRFSKRRLQRQGFELTEQDYMIVCGDFGMCWEWDRTFHYNCEMFEQKPYTILWVQGNHENYDMIAEFPLEEWHGGKVRHIVRDKVILLEKGQVFEIDGKTFFTFGGAASHDIQGGILDRNAPDFYEKKRRAMNREFPYRILHESWWPQELPDEEEIEEARKNLECVNYQVDYVITHCCATGIQDILDKGPGHLYEADILTDFLQEVEEKLEYKHWYFGHYHCDRSVDEKHSLLYHGIVSVGQEVRNDVPILGKPKYQLGDMVKIAWGPDGFKVGRVSIVDAYGTFEQSEEPSYDIYIEEENCLYKHICESEILGKEI